jgi:tRNA A-37 threonylcarbamoyl transferase component Bud32
MGTLTPAVPPGAPQPGRPITRVLGERYALTRRIAIGGMGEVWAANDTVLGREVAVKILRAELVDSSVFLKRFRAEARHTAALTHVGIASVYDYGEDVENDRRTAYLVMELVPGEPLSDVMAREGALPVRTVLSLLAQTADALSAAHEMGVVHRDVKPGNLLVRDDGTVKVTDFGIAHAVDSVPITEVGQVIGTAKYMSPEQASGAEATPASDIYSLGVIGYEMLAGHAPFTTENPAALAMAHVHRSPDPLPDTVPAGVRAVIARALAKDPSERPPDALAFAHELRRLSAATPLPDSSIDVNPATVAMSVGELVAPTRVLTKLGPATDIMPAPPASADVDDFVIPQQRRPRPLWRRWLILGAAVFGLVVLAAVASTHDNGGAGDSPTTAVATTAVATTAPAVASVTVDPNAVIGKPVADAERLLRAAGLNVRVRDVDAPDVPGGIVTGVDPSGSVSPGATVTLDVSNTQPDKGHGKGKDKPKP